MLTSHDTRRLARQLVGRYGTVAVAAAMLQAQRAERTGDFARMSDWRRVAHQALLRSSLRTLAH